jgi:hypothetical protein
VVWGALLSEAANAADRFQYPPGDFRWRLWLLIERVDEVFAAAQRAGMCQPSDCSFTKGPGTCQLIN